jgi:hypothetical protein
LDAKMHNKTDSIPARSLLPVLSVHAAHFTFQRRSFQAQNTTATGWSEHLAGHKHRAGEDPQQRGVDGLPSRIDRAGLDQSAIDLGGDLSAPVASEMLASPYAQHSQRRLDN